MSSFEERQSSVTSTFQEPEQVEQLSPVEQLPFPDALPMPGKTTRHLENPGSSYAEEPLSHSSTTQELADYFTSPKVTHILPEINTGTLFFPPTKVTTTTLRQPIVIRGSGKKKPVAVQYPHGRKWVISSAAIVLLLFITLGTAIAASPLTGGSGHLSNPIQLVASLVHSSNNNPNLIAQQATATAVLQQDGYDPNQGTTPGVGVGVSTIAGGGSLNRFAFGQCTYWANMHYHALTGDWVPWLGNAYQWAYGAASSGWIVSSRPKVPSIIVLQPGVQGAGYFGHVAVVEKINADGSVLTSNFNWYSNGGWDILSYVTFMPGPGVSFVSHP